MPRPWTQTTEHISGILHTQTSQHWAVCLHGQKQWSSGPDTWTSLQEHCSHSLHILWADTGDKDHLKVPCAI